MLLCLYESIYPYTRNIEKSGASHRPTAEVVELKLPRLCLGNNYIWLLTYVITNTVQRKIMEISGVTVGLWVPLVLSVLPPKDKRFQKIEHSFVAGKKKAELLWASHLKCLYTGPLLVGNKYIELEVCAQILFKLEMKKDSSGCNLSRILEKYVGV